MKIFKYSFLVLLVAIVITSCTKNFEEINTNNNGPVTVPAGLLTSSILERTMDRMLSSFVGGDMGQCWAQQWGKVQYNDEARYIPRGSVLGIIWDDLYAGTLTDVQAMYDLAKGEGNDNLMGVSLVMHAYTFGVLTDMYGDIPYSEAISANAGINSPAYDSQESIYNALLDSLDRAVVLLSSSDEITAGSDIMYSGSSANWQKFANSLKFRMLMRISGAQNVSADLQALVNGGNMFGSNADEAKLVYLESNPNANPQWNTIVFGTREEFKIGATMVDKLIADGDPRLAVYAEVNDAGIYRGKVAGFANVPNAEWSYENVSPVGSFYVQPETPGVFMSYSELNFLMAEAAQKGLIAGGSTAARDFYNEGITANFLYNGLTAADAGAMIGGALNYVPGSGLQQIAEQNWVALYSQGVEAWSEQRRTGFPVLTPAAEGSINAIPSRYTYPPSEQSLNKTNWSAAVAAQGEDALTTKVWWNK